MRRIMVKRGSIHAKSSLSCYNAILRSDDDGGGGGGQNFLQIVPLEGGSSSFAVVVFWRRSLAPSNSFCLVGGPDW